MIISGCKLAVHVISHQSKYNVSIPTVEHLYVCIYFQPCNSGFRLSSLKNWIPLFHHTCRCMIDKIVRLIQVSRQCHMYRLRIEKSRERNIVRHLNFKVFIPYFYGTYSRM